MGVMPTLAELVLEELEPEVAPLMAPEPDVVPLEPTCFAPAATPAPALLPELEPTSVVEVDVESLDVERFAPPVREPATAHEPGACRYCRAPSAPGHAFCEHCGMHL